MSRFDPLPTPTYTPPATGEFQPRWGNYELHGKQTRAKFHFFTGNWEKLCNIRCMGYPRHCQTGQIPLDHDACPACGNALRQMEKEAKEKAKRAETQLSLFDHA